MASKWKFEFGSANDRVVMICFGAACGVRHSAGLPLDPNVNTLGAMVRGNTVHIRLVREALCVVAGSHLLLRVESNGL